MKKGQHILSVLNLAGFALGAALGLLWPGFFEKIGFIGTVYVNLLKLMVIPVLMCTVFCAVAQGVSRATRLLGKTVTLFALMFALSFLLTAAGVGLLQPGAGVSLAGEVWEGEGAALSLSEFFISIFPSNIIDAMGRGSMMPCILFAAACGLGAGKKGAGGLISLVKEAESVLYYVLGGIMYLTPLGVFSLMGKAVSSFGGEVLATSLTYILFAWGGCLAVLLVVMMLPLWLFARVTPLQYFRRMSRVLITALSTCSSAATLPETLRTCREEFGVPEKFTGLVAPLGCTIHMCGGAVSFCLLGLFTMQMAGQSVSLGSFVYMLLVAEIMNMAAPGIPGGGIVLGAGYLGIIGAPLSIMGMYSGIYRVLDMAYTTLNVAGDVTANVLLYESERRKRQ